MTPSHEEKWLDEQTSCAAHLVNNRLCTKESDVFVVDVSDRNQLVDSPTLSADCKRVEQRQGGVSISLTAS